MLQVLTDKKIQQLAKLSTDNLESEFQGDIAHFLIDFGIISHTVAFLIALQTRQFLNDLLDYILFIFSIKPRYRILYSFITLLLVLILCYLFVRYIFYKYIYTEKIAKETIAKKVIAEKTKDEMKKEVSRDPLIKQKIHERVQINPRIFEF